MEIKLSLIFYVSKLKFTQFFYKTTFKVFYISCSNTSILIICITKLSSLPIGLTKIFQNTKKKSTIKYVLTLSYTCVTTKFCTQMYKISNVTYKIRFTFYTTESFFLLTT